ncbi:MAG: glycine C-acetyltransferase [Gemmataceae bacterium]
MSDTNLRRHLRTQLDDLKQRGLYKRERYIQTPQDSSITVGGRQVINFCANNYLGLANHPAIVEAAHEGLRKYGYGLASVRFICGTQELHKQLEAAVAKFFQKEDSILYTSCFDANGGLFEPLLDDTDAILSDELNHASIIDGVRLCKAGRYRYKHGDIDDLRKGLEQTKDCRFKIISTDSVFSMDGDLAKLPDICALADEYDAIVMIDDCHATGFLGENGRGAAEQLGVLDRIDIITSTLGKALGGAAGGFTTGRSEIIDWLRNRSRPYLFSNALPPPLAFASLKALEIAAGAHDLRKRVRDGARRMRAGLEAAGFKLKPGDHAILPVMLGDATLATKVADRLLEKGVYVIGFSFPVVPQGQARIRLQVSAAHTDAQIEHTLRSFIEVGKELGVI